MKLAARLQPALPPAPLAAAHLTPKWPVPARIAIVVGMSGLCWAGIYLAVAAIL